MEDEIHRLKNFSLYFRVLFVFCGGSVCDFLHEFILN